jgi:hypothetical protein
LSDDEETSQSEGGMAEHLVRYKNYLDNLKQGKSSGISSVFGRASDLLPPEVMEIKQPKQIEARNQSSQSVDKDDDLEESDDLDAFEVVPDDSEDVGIDDDSDEEDELSDEEDGFDSGGSDDDADASADEDEDEDDEVEDDECEDEDDGYCEAADDDEDSGDSIFEEDDTDSEDSQTDDQDPLPYTNELTVTTINGAMLWKIFFNRAEPVLILMNDGSSIRNAEGRDDAVLALKSTGDRFKFFILSGLVIDPSTGNIYAEANDGAYTAAFLNNGWQIHQYRTHSGSETYYATEPYKKGRERATMQITNLKLNPATGEVSYDSLDGSASMTLKSRRL